MNFIVSHKCKRFVNEIQYANDNRVKIRHLKKQKLVVFKCRTLFVIDFSSSSSVIDFNHFWQTVRLFSSGNQNLTENFFFKFFLIITVKYIFFVYFKVMRLCGVICFLSFPYAKVSCFDRSKSNWLSLHKY